MGLNDSARQFAHEVGGLPVLVILDQLGWHISLSLDGKIVPVPNSGGSTPEEAVERALQYHYSKVKVGKALVNSIARVYSWVDPTDPERGCWGPSAYEDTQSSLDLVRQIEGIRAVGCVSEGLFVAFEPSSLEVVHETIVQLLKNAGYQDIHWR